MTKIQLAQKVDKLKPNILGIAFYMSGILFARVTLFGFAPFGIAHLAMNRKFGWRTLVSLALTLVGTLLIGDIYVMIKYAMALLLYVAMLYFLVQEEELSVSAAGLVAAGSVFISSSALLIWVGEPRLNDFMFAVIEAAVVFLSVYVFDRNFGNKKLRIVVMACVLVISLGYIEIGNIFLASNFLAVVIILILALGATEPREGQSKATTTAGAGIVLGIICGFGSFDMLLYIAVFGVCSFIAGYGASVSRRVSNSQIIKKLVAAAGFSVSYILLATYVIRGINLLTFFELAASAGVIMILPRSMFEYAGWFVTAEKEREIADVSDKASDESAATLISERLNSAAAMFHGLAAAYGKIFERQDPNKIENKEDISQLFDTAADRVCRKCKKAPLCWTRDFSSTYDVCFKLLAAMESSGGVAVADAPQHFREKCIRLPEFLGELNALYEIYRVNCIWKNKMAENRELLGEQYRGISHMLNDLIKEIECRPRVRADREVNEKFSFEVAASARGLSLFEQNGDSHCFVPIGNGKYAVILSDGMGHGNLAAEESGVIIEILRNILKNGFDKAIAVKMINSIMGLKAKDRYSTADICILDSENGGVEFIKIGAAAAYIKAKNKVESVCVPSLPVGVLPNMEIETYRRALRVGDYIVMISDGVLSGAGNWVKQFILESNSDMPPQVLADKIIKQAKNLENSQRSDDMMCIVIQVNAAISNEIESVS
ncbi:MAG: SpoIIE family protein phosphatase [Oscillospiraceae bacterium]|nr:SpoIIE family protein phosphatase [Oscillospiraceae bacterium]